MVEAKSVNPSELYKKILEAQRKPASDDDFTKPNPTPIATILEQRNSHRNCLFYFSLWMSGLSLAFLAIIIGIQIWLRSSGKVDFQVLDGIQLEFLITGVISQFFAVIIVITRSLWDDRPYKDFLDVSSKS